MSGSNMLRAGKGVPLIFLHGIGGAARLWTPQIEHFSRRGYEAIAFDLPGYGGQEQLDDGISFDQLADALEDVIARTEVERPVLVGHSLGGMVVQTFLRRHPEGARAAVLSGTSPAFGNPQGEFQQKFLADRLRPLDEGKTMGELAPQLVAGMIGPEADAAGTALAQSCMAATPTETYRAMVRCLVTFDERANLAQISVPVLVLAAELDGNAPPAMMRKMAGYIPGARYVELERAGHLANVEKPDEFNAALGAFLDAAFNPDEVRTGT